MLRIKMTLSLLLGIGSFCLSSGCAPAPEAKPLLANSEANYAVEQRQSPFSVENTVERLKRQIDAAEGLNLFTEVDHGANAIKVQKALRPTVLLIFGNPDVGTQLMQENQLAGLDLPLKLLVTRNAQDKVMITWVDPPELGQRYGLDDNTALLGKIDTNLSNLVEQALQSSG